VITEAVYALERLYLLERSEIAAALQYVFRSSSIDYNADLIDEVFTLYQNRKPLSFVDCYVKLEASGRDADVATFDKKLIKEGAHIREPQ
jgi:predicted nucleic-acid-binding protein